MPFPTLTSGASIITPAFRFTISLASGPQFMMGHYTLSEYGSDVYDSRINATNEAMQATIVEDLARGCDNASN